MEVRISRDVLLNAVHKVQGIVEPKGAMPILSHLHLSAEKDSICIRATDLEIGTLGSYPANVTSDGAVTLNARKLFDIIRELPNEEIYIKKEENNWITYRHNSIFKWNTSVRRRHNYRRRICNRYDFY
mgnify:CR=1 FL=1